MRAPDHALCNQLAPCGAERCNPASKDLSNVPRSMWSRTKFGHSAQVHLFGGGQPVEPHAEEAFVEGGYRRLRRIFNIIVGNGRVVRYIPGVFAPLLNEVGISPGLSHNPI